MIRPVKIYYECLDNLQSWTLTIILHIKNNPRVRAIRIDDCGSRASHVSTNLKFSGLSRDLISFFRPVQGDTRVNDRDNQADGADYGNPDPAFCPQGAGFGGSRCLPLGAQIAFAAPFWLGAWCAIFEGFGVGFSKRRGFKLKWLIADVSIGLIPFLLGII